MDGMRECLYFSNMSARSRIPSYPLYREQAGVLEALHCEALAERSARYGWEIDAHRHAALHQFFLVTEGAAEAVLDGTAETLPAGHVLFVPRQSVHGFRFQTGSDGWVVSTPSEVLQPLFDADRSVAEALAAPAIVPVTETLESCIRAVAREYGQIDAARRAALSALAVLIAVETARAIRRSGRGTAASAMPPLLARFEALVERNYARQWRLTDYARELAVTPTHLSRLCRQAHGVPASRLVEARVILEARRMLAYTTRGVAQIAYHLGYEDPAYFSRVFQRATGVAPSRFRAEAAGQKAGQAAARSGSLAPVMNATASDME